MSFNRLRQLAGLTETIADEPETNLAIERRLDTLPEDIRGPVLDALELLKDAGADGLLLQAWADQVRQLHDVASAGALLKTVVQNFPMVVSRRARGHYVWQVVRASEDEVIDPALKASLHGQVALTSRAFALMRQRSRFTAEWLAAALASNTLATPDAGPLPKDVARGFVDHLLTQFAGMLTRQGDTYALKTEPPTNRADTMAGLRGLASNPPKPPGG